MLYFSVGKKKKKGKETPSPPEEEKPATPVEPAQHVDADAEQNEKEDGDEADNKPTTVRLWTSANFNVCVMNSQLHSSTAFRTSIIVSLMFCVGTCVLLFEYTIV